VRALVARVFYRAVCNRRWKWLWSRLVYI